MQNNMTMMVVGIIVAIIVGVGLVGAIVLTSMSRTESSQQVTDKTAPPTDQPGQTDPLTNSQTNNIVIKNRAFSPASITVKKGTKVTWVNQDSMDHNVVSDGDAPAGGPPTTAPLLAKNQEFAFTYDTVGTFSYHCMSHPDMKGMVIVVE